MDCGLHEIETPYLRRLYEYWQSKRRGGAFPARRDLDPQDFGYALGHVILIEVLHEPLRFRFRLHGTSLAFRANYEMTGKFVDDLPDPQNRTVLRERCHQLLRERRPVFARSQRMVDGQHFGYEVAWMPLSSDGTEIDMLLGALAYFDDPGRLAMQPDRPPLPATV